MPETIREIINVRYVRGGDVLTGAYNQNPVHIRKFGTRWATFRDADEKLILRVPLDETVSIQREQETAEEQATRRHERRCEHITDWVENYETDFAHLLIKFSQRLSESTFRNNSDYYDEVLQAEADRNIKRQIAHMMAYVDEETGESPDAAAAFDAWAERFKSQLLDGYSQRALSRSTSVMSNLIDDVATERGLRALNDYRLQSY